MRYCAGAALEADVLIDLFDRILGEVHATRLQGGGAEPRYLPRRGGRPARIIFREDYFASALHELAHWCIAGARRRALEDYGYWYAPDGRDAAMQRRFQQVEARPQALEAVFAEACGAPFRISLDNLDGDHAEVDAFAAAVEQARSQLHARGLPPRARLLEAALRRTFAPAAAPVPA